MEFRDTHCSLVGNLTRTSSLVVRETQPVYSAPVRQHPHIEWVRTHSLQLLLVMMTHVLDAEKMETTGLLETL